MHIPMSKKAQHYGGFHFRYFYYQSQKLSAAPQDIYIQGLLWKFSPDSHCLKLGVKYFPVRIHYYPHLPTSNLLVFTTSNLVKLFKRQKPKTFGVKVIFPISGILLTSLSHKL